MLDPDGRRICELLLQEEPERDITAIMGASWQSTFNTKKESRHLMSQPESTRQDEQKERITDVGAFLRLSPLP
jgi:hypothetical protein